MINLLLGFGSRFIFLCFFFFSYYTKETKQILVFMVFIKINDTFFHKASEQVRDRETINGALMQIFVHLDL